MKKLSKMQRRVLAAVNPVTSARIVGQYSPKRAVQLWTPQDQEVSEAFDVQADQKLALKGKKDANCNRTACQKPRAFFLNCGTDKYYCIECAIDIGCFSLRTRQDPMELFPTFDEDMLRYEEYLEANPVSITRYLKSQVDWAKRERADAVERYNRNHGARV